jgi:hypothetical protein
MSVARKQKKVLAKIHEFTGSAPETPELMGILKMVTHYTNDQLHLAFKDFGARLKSFANAIDLENPHPDLFNLFDGQLTGPGEDSFNQTACDVLRLVAGADFNLSLRVLGSLRDAVCKHPAARLMRHLDNPHNNQLHVRFVKSAKCRNAIRAMKKVQIVGLGLLYGEGEPYWNEAPSDFDLFWRNVNRYEKDIKHAQERQLYFKGFGLEEMSRAIENSMDQMRAACEANQYYGFNPIDLTLASTILAKMLGYEFNVDLNYSSSGNGSYAFALSDHFGDYEFATTNILHPEGKIEYRPRLYIYPTKEVVEASGMGEEPYLPPRMKKLVDHLENFPEAGGHPLFDHYRVLVPGLDYPSANHAGFDSKTPPSFRKVSGELAEFDNWDQAQMELDRHLVEEGLVPAILLGERDGEHYFISYWK